MTTTDFSDLEGERGGVWADLWTTLLSRLTALFTSLAGVNATSVTPNSIGTGDKSFNLSPSTTTFPEGVVVRARRMADAATYLLGPVTTSAPGSVTITVPAGGTGGSGGDYIDWVLTVDLTTAAPTLTPRAISGAGTVGTGDKGGVLYCSTTATLAFTAVATLGEGFWCAIVNDSGIRTLDPDGSETIDGRMRIKLAPGDAVMVAVVNGALKVIASKGYGQGLRVWPSVVSGSFDIEDGWAYRVDTSSAIAIGMLQDGAGDGARFKLIDHKRTFGTNSCWVDAYSAGYDTVVGEGSHELDVGTQEFVRTDATADWGYA